MIKLNFDFFAEEKFCFAKEKKMTFNDEIQNDQRCSLQ